MPDAPGHNIQLAREQGGYAPIQQVVAEDATDPNSKQLYPIGLVLDPNLFGAGKPGYRLAVDTEISVPPITLGKVIGQDGADPANLWDIQGDGIGRQALNVTQNRRAWLFYDQSTTPMTGAWVSVRVTNHPVILLVVNDEAEGGSSLSLRESYFGYFNKGTLYPGDWIALPYISASEHIQLYASAGAQYRLWVLL